MSDKTKDDIRRKLLAAGRRLAAEKGVEYLTARKLSEAAGCSVGTIYNLFVSMDDFVAEENEQTLSELYDILCSVCGGDKDKGYRNICAYAACFNRFVADRRALWTLFYSFHLNLRDYRLPVGYRRLLVRLEMLLTPDFAAMFPAIEKRRLRLAQKVLAESLMALSTLPERQNSAARSAVLLNTYLAGLMMLNKGEQDKWNF